MKVLEGTAIGTANTAEDKLRSSQIVSIGEEGEWRLRPRSWPSQKAAVTRWRADEQKATEVATETPKDCYVVGIALRRSNLRFSIFERLVLDGVAMPGTLLLTEPGAVARCTYQGPFDELHLHLPKNLVIECASELPDHQAAVLRSGVITARDPLIERLGRTLLGIEDINSSIGRLYLESISTAIVARLLSPPEELLSRNQRKETELLRWRLRRAIDYIEANLAEPVTLSDMAASTGLTRMHFAAQFRAATGLRPHEYLLRRRIERAQQLLLETQLPLVEVALLTGFQTQSHFTAVFNRFVGRPPRNWRNLHEKANHDYQRRARGSRLEVAGILQNANARDGAVGL